MGLLRAILRMSGFVLLSIYIVIVQSVLLAFYRGPASYAAPWTFQAGARLLFGIRVTTEGRPARGRQTLYVANHLSYLDIPVIGSYVFGSFVARGDLSRWPLFGYMSKMQQTIFISRERKDAAEGKNQLEKQLNEGKNLIIFAQGTSSDGSTVLPFKSSLFGLAMDNPTGKPLQVQPITISLLEVDGRPATGQAVRNLYAWHGDMTLPPHFWQFAKLRGAQLKVTFHPPRDAANYTDRKKLCQDCYSDVSKGLEQP